MLKENAVQQFTNEQLGVKVRVIDKDGEPWFVGNDVANALGYSRPRNAIKEHCKGGTKMVLPSAGGQQEVIVIPESDLYRLILRSKLPHAEAIQDWVVIEVLPSIRKNGFYITPKKQEETASDQEDAYRLAEALLEERDRRELAEDRLQVFKPRTQFGTPSRINGRPRVRAVPGYFRSTKITTTVTEVTEYQRRLFDIDGKTAARIASAMKEEKE